MDLQLNGKLALVTGSTLGIGLATVQALLREGARVIVNGRDPGRVARAASALGEAGRVIGLAGDVATAAGCAALVEAVNRVGPLDILVNNAGIFEPKPFEEIPDADWQRFYDVNVMSGVRLSRAFMPAMRERQWGRIIFVSSESGLSTPVEMIHYGMTKTAQLAISRGLAKALRGTGVTVNSVLPGPTWTEGVADFVEKMAAAEGVPVETMKREFVKRHRPNSIIERFATPEEVADVIAFLCSPRASAISGAAQRVEGGLIDTIG